MEERGNVGHESDAPHTQLARRALLSPQAAVVRHFALVNVACEGVREQVVAVERRGEVCECGARMEAPTV